MSLCDGGREFIDSSRKDHFTGVSRVIMDQIRSSLFSNAEPTNPSQTINIPFRSGRQLQANRDIKVVELQEEDILELTGYRHSLGQLKGAYVPDLGKLFLNHELWCLKTFIHETLHSVSVTSKNSLFHREYLSFYEGLTELYTGYLLKKHYNFCYNDCWRRDEESRCKCTYSKDVKMWLGVCHFIPFNYTFPLYFWNGENNLASLWRTFIERIRDYGYINFEMIIDQDRKPKWLAFHQEARKRFGRTYLDIYNEIMNPLDLSILLE